MLHVADLRTHERLTLEIGSSVVLSALAFGLQVGRWSPWTVIPALAGYFLWVIAYSEASLRRAR